MTLQAVSGQGGAQIHLRSQFGLQGNWTFCLAQQAIPEINASDPKALAGWAQILNSILIGLQF